MRDAQFSGQTSTTSFCEIRLKCKYFLRPLTAALANTDGLTSAVTSLHTPASPQQRTEPANTGGSGPLVKRKDAQTVFFQIFAHIRLL